MAAKQRNSSAPRNNRSDTNDIADTKLVDQIFANASAGKQLDRGLDQMKGLYIAQELKKGFALAKASPATWQLFLSHGFWAERPEQKPRASDQETALRFVLRIYFGELNSGNKRANEVWTAVQQLSRESLSQAQICAEFQKGFGTQGMDIKAVCKRAADHNRGTRLRKSVPQAVLSAIDAKDGRAASVASPDHNKKPKIGERATPVKKHTSEIQLNLPDGSGVLAALQKGAKFRGEFEVIDITNDGLTVKLIKVKLGKSK